jgi:hypothetical protein
MRKHGWRMGRNQSGKIVNDFEWAINSADLYISPCLFNKKKYNNGHIGPITEKIRNQFMAEVKFNFITNKSLKGLST